MAQMADCCQSLSHNTRYKQTEWVEPHSTWSGALSGDGYSSHIDFCSVFLSFLTTDHPQVYPFAPLWLIKRAHSTNAAGLHLFSFFFPGWVLINGQLQGSRSSLYSVCSMERPTNKHINHKRLFWLGRFSTCWNMKWKNRHKEKNKNVGLFSFLMAVKRRI